MTTKAIAHKNNLKHQLSILGLATSVLLLIPLVSMLFSDEFNWNPGDFIFAGAFFYTMGLIYIFLINKSASKNQKILIGSAIFLVFAYIWAELAVGIFTNLGS